MSKETELLPCPFCGAQPEWNGHGEWFMLQCSALDDACGGRPCTHEWLSEDKTINEWNTRPSAPQEVTEKMDSLLAYMSVNCRGENVSKAMEKAKQVRQSMQSVSGIPADKVLLDSATSIAGFLWKEFYAADAPDWKALPDLQGVLSQISNMVAGLTGKEADIKYGFHDNHGRQSTGGYAR